MGFFKRKKDEEAKIQLEREALDKLNSNDTELFDIPSNSAESEWHISGKMRAPHTITAEEINAHSPVIGTDVEDSFKSNTEEIPMSSDSQENNSPAEFLYQKMMQSRTKNQESASENENIQNDPTELSEKSDEQASIETPKAPLDIEAAINDIRNTANVYGFSQTSKVDSSSEQQASTAPKTLIPEETKNVETASGNSDETFADFINEGSDINTDSKDSPTSLFSRCNAYLEGSTDTIKVDTEKYKLESVESILEDFEARAAERINKKFNTTVSPVTSAPDQSAPTTTDSGSQRASNTNKPLNTDNTIVFDSHDLSIKSNIECQNHPENSSTQIKHIFTADTPSLTPPPVTGEIDDFSSTRIIADINNSPKKVDDIFSSSKTSVFPVIENIVNTPSSQNDISENSSTADEEENNDFEDYKTIADRPKILNSLLRKKKAFTFKLVLSLLAFILSLVFSTPLSQNIVASKTTINIIEVIICLFILFVNFNTLSSLKFSINSKSKSALPAALSLLASNLFSIINLIVKSDFIGFSALTAISLLSYNLANRNFYSKAIKNFNLIANTEFKNAVSIIQNKQATKNIVGNSIEGSALVCYGGETTNIHNFLKYTFCKNPVSTKIQKTSLIALILGVFLSIITLLLNPSNVIFPLYILCAVICFSAIPSVYHIVGTTVNSANKRLNHYDAMITGYRAADELELCNAVAVNCESLFPEGTIRLVDMKLLSPNPFDQSILDAAAIAEAIHSPLAGIFKQMDASKAYDNSTQDVDTVIYEEKMGISGWVNDRRVFVGNRDLLIAHGFTGLPPAELDKKIMRKGYFPIYIASDNIPCALLVVKYEPDQDIVYEIQRLANTGTTIIVDNCDPNISAQMLTDYFELYSETIFVMSKQGSDYYKALVPHKEHRRAGVAYKKRIEGLFAALTASINIKKYVSRMTVFHICSVVLGLLALMTCIFTSLIKIITPLNILLLQIILTTLTLLPVVLRKP